MDTGNQSKPPVRLDEGDSKDLYPNPKGRKGFVIAGIASIVWAAAILIFDDLQSSLLAVIIFLLVGASLLYGAFYAKKRDKYEEYLLKSGDCYWANITDCILRRHYYKQSSRYSNSYTLVCRYKEKNGDIWECKRSALGYDPRPYINNGQVKIYVDPAKPKNLNNYAMDVKGSMDSQPDQPGCKVPPISRTF